MKVKETYTKGTLPPLYARILIYAFVGFLAILCVLPMVNVLAISLTTSETANYTNFWPKEFTFQSYQLIFKNSIIIRTFFNSIYRTVLGVALSVVITPLMAYPLSKSGSFFKTRKIYITIILTAMLFNGGLVPTYLLIANTLGMKNSYAALILPAAVPIFNVIVTMNFFKQLPHELEEAAEVDGANYFITLFTIVMPLSMPVIATTALFQMVYHWNDWFGALIYITDIKRYPMQTYLQSTLQAPSIKSMLDLQAYIEVSDRTLSSAQIIISAIPLMVTFPLLQKFFVKGMVIGAVKG